MTDDDLIIRPRLTKPEASTPTETRQRRVAIAQARRGGANLPLLLAAARRGVGAATEAIGLSDGEGAIASRAGLVGAAALFGIAAAARVFTGRPFESMGQQLKDDALGDLDQEAGAMASARHYLEDQPGILLAVENEGRITPQLQKVFESLRVREMQRFVGRNLINAAFPVNNTADMIVMGAIATIKGIRDRTNPPSGGH